jgi:hypothetical protein
MELTDNLISVVQERIDDIFKSIPLFARKSGASNKYPRCYRNAQQLVL